MMNFCGLAAERMNCFLNVDLQTCYHVPALKNAIMAAKPKKSGGLLIMLKTLFTQMDDCKAGLSASPIRDYLNRSGEEKMRLGYDSQEDPEVRLFL
jgi:hypothetical protein